MAYKKQSGRKAVVSLIVEGAAVSGGTSVTLTKGTFYTVLKKLASGSALPASEGHQFLATDALALAEGEKVIPLSDPWTKDNIFGFANSKGFDQNKNSYDQTVDWDDENDTALDDLVTRSGSISGFTLNDAPEGCAYNKIQAEYMHTVDQNATETANKEIAPSTPVHLICYIDNKETPKAGDKVFLRFIPVQISQISESSSYGSATTCQMSWVGAERTEAGSKATKLAATIPAAA